MRLEGVQHIHSGEPSHIIGADSHHWVAHDNELVVGSFIFGEPLRARLSTHLPRVAEDAKRLRSRRSSLVLNDFSPDVVLSDHSLGTFDAQSALALLHSIRPTTPFILVTGVLNSEATVACIRGGAEDLIMKDNLSRLAASITKAVQLRRALEKLTPRQIEVLRMVAEGHRTREIATRLKLSVKTVESHRGEIMKRLAIHDVVGLVRYAMRVGLVSPAA
jgi:DNA-binding NarL/FixJ family response regulator